MTGPARRRGERRSCLSSPSCFALFLSRQKEKTRLCRSLPSLFSLFALISLSLLRRKGANPLKDPAAIIGIVAIFLPFVILGIAIATGIVEIPER